MASVGELEVSFAAAVRSSASWSSACSPDPKGGQQCTSARYDLDCGKTGQTPGGDKILIHKSDLKNDRCTTLHLARPTDGDPALAIDVPEMWGPQNAGIAMGLEGCLEGTPGDLGVAAIAGSGTITWQLAPNEFCPKIISLNLDLEFPQNEPWLPAKEHLETMDLAVQDCP